MRKIKYFLLAFILALTCFSPLALTGCGKKLNWNGLSIAGFDDFVSIGAVSFEDKNIVYADEKHNSPKMKLAGFDADGVCKQITFEDEKGKKSKQKAHLLHFDAYENYTIVSFTTNKNQEFVNLDTYYYTYWDSYYFSLDSYYRSFSNKDCFMFVIDNSNGKIYDMRHIVDAVKDVCQYKTVSLNFANLSDTGKAMYYNKAYNDPFILLSVQENVDGRTSRSLCKVEFQDNNIKVSQKMNNTQIQNFNEGSQALCDRYGHVFSCSGLNLDLISVDRYQKLDGTFVEVSQDAQYKFGTNSILYMWQNNKTFYLNANDEFEEIDFDFGKIISWSQNFHTYNGYLYVVLEASPYQYQNFNHGLNLLKVKFDSEYDWKYTCEEKVLNIKGQIKAQGKYVYIIKDKNIYVYDITTDQIEMINSKYEFKNLTYNKNYDQVRFKAVDTTTLLEVDGYFTDKGEIVVGDFEGLKAGLNRVFIVKPLN